MLFINKGYQEHKLKFKEIRHSDTLHLDLNKNNKRLREELLEREERATVTCTVA